MKKNVLNWLLMGALVCSLSMAFAACSDDDEKKEEKEDTPDEVVDDPEEERMDSERQGVMMLLYNLAGVQFDKDFDDDVNFEGETYEPTIGLDRDPANPLVRSVKVQDATYCEKVFRALVDDDTFIRETADGCIIDMSNLDCRSDGKKQNFGTLTFHRGNGGDNVGYADVNIPCIPKLQRIVYLTQEQWGENASFDSPCEYGDVYLGDNHYWICVRESQGVNTKKKELRGVLVNIQCGRGDYYYTGYSEVWDAKPIPDVQDIYDYLTLCGNESFLSQKKRICKKLPNKVFPQLCKNPGEDYKIELVGNEDSGFANKESGYIFHSGDNTEFEDAHIFYTYYRGKYKLFKGKKRHQKYVKVPAKCMYLDEVENKDYDSWGDGGFRNLRRHHYPYTLSSTNFWGEVPAGFTLVDI